MFQEPVDTLGVIAFPNPSGVRDCRFVDGFGNVLFKVSEGENVLIRYHDGEVKTKPCVYIDDYHIYLGETYHVDQFAEIMERIGATYAPEKPMDGDVLDTYEVWQIRDVSDAGYAFMDYDFARKRIKLSDYRCVYHGMLHPKTTLEKLFIRHNGDYRPRSREMRSMSVSDVVVLIRRGERKAFYVDSCGFVPLETAI